MLVSYNILYYLPVEYCASIGLETEAVNKPQPEEEIVQSPLPVVLACA